MFFLYWDSWNDFFHREIKLKLRPIEGGITSCNDGFVWVYPYRDNIKKENKFWLKDNMPYSIFTHQKSVFECRKCNVSIKKNTETPIWNVSHFSVSLRIGAVYVQGDYKSKSAILSYCTG